MAKSATLAIRIVSDASNASKGFDEAESRVSKFQRGLDKVTPAAAGTVAAIGAVATKAYESASRLEQSTGAINSVFGDWALDIEQEAAKAAQALGLSSSAYQESAALIGSQLKTLGYDSGEAVDGVKSLTAQAADLAATFGGTTEEAVSALSSALKGERDPIERYGISLSQAAVDAKVAALGLDTSTEAAKTNANAQATLALIAEQGASAQGAFAREAGTAAGQTQRAQAEWENASAALGQVLLPIVSSAALKLSELARWMVANKDVVIPLIAVIGGLAGGVLALNGAMRVYSAVQLVVNAAMRANPIMLVVTALAALAAGFVWAYNNVKPFRDAVQSVVKWLKDAWEWVKKLADRIANSGIGKAVGALFGSHELIVQPRVAPLAGTGNLAGVYGAAAPAAGPGIYGAAGSGMTALAGGRSTAGQGSPVASTVVHVNVPGLVVDPVGLGRTLTTVLRDYARSTGSTLTVNMGRAT